jgi:hypothetical protein
MNRHLPKKQILFIGAILGIALVCCILIITLVPVGPGLPPFDIRNDWFIPHANITVSNDTLLYPFIVDQTNSFPFTSVPNGRCSHVEYGISATEPMLMAASLYFQKRDDFLHGQTELCHYLSAHGKTEPVLLHMEAPEGHEYNLSATRYSTNTFQGYFIIAERSFLSSSEDYFILYYGYPDSDSHRESEELLNSLIARAGLDWAREGSTGELDCKD